MFDSEIDKFLWLILESDEENRKDIIALLKLLPNDFLDVIRSAFKKVELGQNEMDIHGSVDLEDGTFLQYELYFIGEELNLVIKQGLKLSNDKNNYIDFESELLLIKDLEEYADSELWLGTYSNTCYVNTKEKLDSSVIRERFMPFLNFSAHNLEIGGCSKERETEYNLVVTDEGYAVRKSGINGEQLHFIDINDMPEVLTIQYIINRYGDEPYPRKRTPNN